MHGLPEAATWQNSAMQLVLFLYLHVHGPRWHRSTSLEDIFSKMAQVDKFRRHFFAFASSWTKVTQVDKFRGHFFGFATSWTKVAQVDKFRGHFFGFASSWTKVAHADKLKGRQCILLFLKCVIHFSECFGIFFRYICPHFPRAKYNFWKLLEE